MEEVVTETVFRLPWYVSSIPVVVAAVPFLVGLVTFLVPKAPGPVKMVGLGAMLFGMLIGAACGPMMFMDRVVVDQEGVTQNTGFWWAQTVKGFSFEGTTKVTVAAGRSRKGIRNDIWHVEKQEGTVERIDPGDLWEANTDEILELVKAKGIEVERK